MDGPLGVQLVVTVVPNPVLTQVSSAMRPTRDAPHGDPDTFAADYGKTLNLTTLQTRMGELQKWYADQGYSLARVTGPTRVSPEGVVQLLVREGTVAGVEVQFLNKEGKATNDKGQPIRGKTKTWVVTREMSIKPGDIFNRRKLEDDIKRLYGTGLFSDVKVTLRPVAEEPGREVIVLGIVEQSSGSLSGGLGYSQSQGVFGQIQLQDSNLLGRAWDLAVNFTYGQFGGLADVSFTDPWIKGDKLPHSLPRAGVLQPGSAAGVPEPGQRHIYTVSDFYEAPGTAVAYNIDSLFNPLGEFFPSVTAARIASEASGQDLSWFEYDGNTVLIQRVGRQCSARAPTQWRQPLQACPLECAVGILGPGGHADGFCRQLAPLRRGSPGRCQWAGCTSPPTRLSAWPSTAPTRTSWWACGWRQR